MFLSVKNQIKILIKKCTYIILQGKGTIDEKIYNCLQRKGNAVDELYMEMGLKVEN